MSSSIIVVPHYDDELFCAGSFLLSYKHDINIVFTHTTDFISKKEEYKQSEFLINSMKIINKYRKEHKMPEIKMFVTETLDFARHLIENMIKDAGKIDYFITTAMSTHPSHTECHNFCIELLRWPYISKIQDFLTATYPQNWLSTCQQQENCFFGFKKEIMQILERCFDAYAPKIKDNLLLCFPTFYHYCELTGLRVGQEFAQPFIIKQHNVIFEEKENA